MVETTCNVCVIGYRIHSDLVLAVRGQKKGGGGGGRGKERKKGQNLTHASTAHALNLTCFHVYGHTSSSIPRCVLL